MGFGKIFFVVFFLDGRLRTFAYFLTTKVPVNLRLGGMVGELQKVLWWSPNIICRFTLIKSGNIYSYRLNVTYK